MKKSTVSRRLQGFERTIQTRRRSWDVPGVAVGVVADGDVVLSAGAGTRRLGHSQPVTADTVFAICSCSKAFTTLVLGMLVEEGKLDWNRPVQDVLPEFALFDRMAGERLTARDLVTHRCGLPRHDYVWYGSSATRAELVQALRYLPPTADVRTEYQYQNLMYMTAGHLAGRLTDSTWEDLVRERIFEPLGMTATTVALDGLQASHHGARPHEDRSGRMREVPYRSLDAVGPAGSINSSVNDMTRWLRLHLDGGRFEGRRLVSAATLRDMYRPHMAIGDGGDDVEFQLLSYGLGWTAMAYRGHRVLTHSGGIDGFRCRVALLPDEGAGTVVLTNGDTQLPHVLTWELLDALLGLEPAGWSRRIKAQDRRESAQASKDRRQSLAKRVRGTRPSHRLGEYAGQYQHPGYGRVVIRAGASGARGKLSASLNDLHGTLKHHHYDTFEFHCDRWPGSMLLTFAAAADGKIMQLALPLQEGLDDIIFTRASDSGEKE